MPIQEQSVIEGWRGVLVAAGLKHPWQRCITAALLAGSISYLLKQPRRSFREDGSIRPAGHTADSTDWHFFLSPAIVGGLVFLFT